MPDAIAGTPIKGKHIPMGRRRSANMVLENASHSGLCSKPCETDDPRSPGHKLIDNTLVIFTSDNGPSIEDTGPNRKAEVAWQSKDLGGQAPRPLCRVLEGNFEGGQINRNLFSLTDLFATGSNSGRRTQAQRGSGQPRFTCAWKDPSKPTCEPAISFATSGHPMGTIPSQSGRARKN